MLQDAIVTGLKGATPKVRDRALCPRSSLACRPHHPRRLQMREVSAKCFWLFAGHFPDRRDRFLTGLDPRTRRIVERGKVSRAGAPPGARAFAVLTACRARRPRRRNSRRSAPQLRLGMCMPRASSRSSLIEGPCRAVLKGALTRRRTRQSISLGSARPGRPFLVLVLVVSHGFLSAGPRRLHAGNAGDIQEQSGGAARHLRRSRRRREAAAGTTAIGCLPVEGRADRQGGTLGGHRGRRPW